MSLVSPRGEQSSDDEILTLTALTNLDDGYVRVNKKWEGYSRRIELTINATAQDNYLLDIDLSTFGSNFWDYVKNNGGDIRITTSDGLTECAREVRDCNISTETGNVFVLIPSVDSNTIIYLFYGNENNTDYGDDDTYGKNAVWNNVESISLQNTTYKGGVLRVIDDATGDIARTTNGWLEDNEALGVYFVRDASSVSGELDSEITRTGRLTGKITTSDATGKGRFVLGYPGGTGASQSPVLLSKYGIVLKPSTSYKLSVWINFSNVANVSLVGIHEHSSDGTRLVANQYTSESGSSSGWVERIISFTTNASTNWGIITIGPANAGDNQIFSLDINDIKLEEVSTITNPSSVPVLYYPTAKAVTSNDNIDQSQVVDGDTMRLGEVVSKLVYQSFLPTKKNNYGFNFKRGGNTGTFTGSVTLSLYLNGAGDIPTGSALSSYTYTNAQWEALGTSDIISMQFPNITTLTIDGSTKYGVVFETSTADDSNYTRLVRSTSDTYPNGVTKTGSSLASFGSDTNKAIIFQTLYSKNTTNFTVRTDTETLSVIAPNMAGWEDGEVISTLDLGVEPLTLQPGVNNVYISSNGADNADPEGDEDPSYQVIIGGNLYSDNTTFTSDYETSNVNFKTLSAENESGITKVQDTNNNYNFDQTPTKLKMKNKYGDGYTYITFLNGQIITSDTSD